MKIITALKIITVFCFVQMLLGCLSLAASRTATEDTWIQAVPGTSYRFPQDHARHPDYKTEWWYFTGNLTDRQGNQFGFELTFFRQGMIPPAQANPGMSDDRATNRFVQNDFKFAHFAISDLTHGKFYYVEKINRGAFGEAGFNAESPLAWMERWSLTPQADGSWQIVADASGESPMSINLRVMPAKEPVVHGTDGVSQKASGLGNASHYYSFTRLKTSGTLAVKADATPRSVTGESWFDHEWASNQLGADQVGWDWFCCQFDDGAELMLYAMRRRDGSVDEVSSGTWVEADGKSTHLTKQDFQLRALRTWKSERTGAVYPVEWQVSVPTLQLGFRLKARLDAQELALPLVSYWEGATAFEGQRGGHPVKGVGYMELTGYAGALKGLQSDKQTAGNSLGRSVR